jgi:hypothetical protein
LGTVAAGIGFVYWWERQLPARVAAAAARGQLDACLRYSDQLDALSWLPGRSSLDQGRCRREKAAQLWKQGSWAAALGLQRQLLNSPAGGRGDRQRLEDWQSALHRMALSRFRDGDLDAALDALAPMGEKHRSDGTAVGDQLRLNWNRNRLEWERASKLVDQARWWEALDSLNRIDHPWWQRRAQALNRKVEQLQSKLNDVQIKQEGNTSKIILTKDQQDAIANFKKQQVEARKDLRKERRNLDVDVKNLENRVKWLNIAAMPLLVSAAGIALAIARKNRTNAK